ncbi:Phytanoyl-CoA dioxygenase [Penicillium occitanis (nom. inval.)]|nr:Phytanoyl-CoA dioxygenase [Penicillium occitanis (nom. inval.)]PCG98245.1 hypothetical protein PENOC_064270 [Penicillium occitanis (nom. inval.)]
MSSTSDAPQVITLTAEERDSGVMSDKKFYDAIEAFFTDGIVVIENAINIDIVDKLNERMLKDTEKLLNDQQAAIYNHLNEDTSLKGALEGGNLSQVPPIEPEWFFPEVYGNKHGVRVMSAILGPRPEVHFLRSNTLLATNDRQLVHADILCKHPEHTFGIAYNTCLVDVGPENGTTELWLGTQNTNLSYHVKNGDPSIAQHHLDERRNIRPPCYPRIKKGSIVLRDLRLWHAGMPNPTKEVRIMLAIVYYAAWYKNELVINMPYSMKPLVKQIEESSESYIAVNWVPDEGYDYLRNEFSRNFSSSLTPEIWEEIERLEAIKKS